MVLQNSGAKKPIKVAIAGAFGFIGQHLIGELIDKTDCEIVAISRSARRSSDERMNCVTADLYTLTGTTDALKGCDVAVYLVHSMAPSSRMSQGNFRDFDFILADNFGRAAQANGIRHIIYVGGMLPDGEELSAHLRSRLEVEEILRSQDIPVTAFRCGMVIGPKGSSFNIIVRLTERLPTMILPQWMRTRSNPIYVGDLAKILTHSIASKPAQHKIIDAGMAEAVSYKEIVVETAKELGKKPVLIDVPYVSPQLSKLWVRLVSGAPKALVYPLIDSVRHQMLASPKQSIPEEWNLKPLALAGAIHASFVEPFTFEMPRLLSSVRNLSEVRSVQRLPLPRGKNAKWVALAYTQWLPFFFKVFIKVKSENDRCEYRLRLLSTLLLQLRLDRGLSQDDRVVYRVKKGLLVAPSNLGRFEFRESHNKEFVIVALHNYRPALPWYLYYWTQAFIHKIVMQRFAQYLRGGYV